MDEGQLDDLKQFITATVSQTEKRLEMKISDVRSELAELRNEMSGGFSGVGEAIESIHDQSTERDIEVDRRLTKLEQQAA